MKNKKITEEEAYQEIRKISMQKRITMVELSEIIILRQGDILL